jgi:CRISP-associated protein Cas1
VPLLAQVADPVNLERAWAAVVANDLDDGNLSEAAKRFAQTARARIEAIAEQLNANTYDPSALFTVNIPKGENDTRELHIPAVRDRIVERAITQVLAPILDPMMHPLSFAFRKGLGVLDATRAIVELREDGNGWALRADVEDCFDSLNRERLLEMLANKIDDAQMVNLVDTLLDRPSTDGRKLKRSAKGAPQGGPLSPLLCNLYLDSIDRAMSRAGFAMVRYADDMVVCVSTPEEAEAAERALMGNANRVDLTLGAEKTERMAFGEGFAFLGEDFNAIYPLDLPLGRVKEPEKRVLYVSHEGSFVKVNKGRLSVHHEKKELLSVPSSLVGSIALFGSASLSSGARSFAFNNDIRVSFLSRRGNFEGYLQSAKASSTKLVKTQLQRAEDPAFATEMARGFVTGKLANLRALLLRYGQRADTQEVIDAADDLEKMYGLAQNAGNAEILLGHEGAGSAAYWKVFGLLLPEGIKFPSRVRRPPTDPVNACLSYGYTLLTLEVTGALAAAGLDPSIGFLHADAQDRPSLALDVMEEFRPLIIDTVVLTEFRRKRLTAESFRAGENQAVMFTESGRKRFLAAFETRMLESFSHTPSGKRMSYRRGLQVQAWQVSSAVRSGEPRYTPVSWR